MLQASLRCVERRQLGQQALTFGLDQRRETRLRAEFRCRERTARGAACTPGAVP